jgi:hypothetical protein
MQILGRVLKNIHSKTNPYGFIDPAIAADSRSTLLASKSSTIIANMQGNYISVFRKPKREGAVYCTGDDSVRVLLKSGIEKKTL